ncbi:hypothetical protein [Mesobacillus thioparans]|uniref:hypothetical protein n=1 Tax=Mesobacillus thioparans TaxID=370439 RepID=UPI0039EEE67E
MGFKNFMAKLSDQMKSDIKQASRKKVDVEILFGGHIVLDKKIPNKIKKATLIEGDNPGEIIVKSLYGQKPFVFDGIDWAESSTRNGGKAAVGAIAGTLVAGPLGTIAGAALGGKKKDTSKALIFLYELDKEQSKPHELHIVCNEDKYREIANLL